MITTIDIRFDRKGNLQLKQVRTTSDKSEALTYHISPKEFSSVQVMQVKSGKVFVMLYNDKTGKVEELL